MVYKSGPTFLPFGHKARTDRRTDRILIARPRLHCMQRGKNAVGAEGVRVWGGCVPFPLGKGPGKGAMHPTQKILNFFISK